MNALEGKFLLLELLIEYYFSFFLPNYCLYGFRISPIPFDSKCPYRSRSFTYNPSLSLSHQHREPTRAVCRKLEIKVGLQWWLYPAGAILSTVNGATWASMEHVDRSQLLEQHLSQIVGYFLFDSSGRKCNNIVERFRICASSESFVYLQLISFYFLLEQTFQLLSMHKPININISIFYAKCVWTLPDPPTSC